jgi:hypothetical protein
MLPIVGKDCDIAVSAGMPALLALRNRVAAIARHQLRCHALRDFKLSSLAPVSRKFQGFAEPTIAWMMSPIDDQR